MADAQREFWPRIGPEGQGAQIDQRTRAAEHNVENDASGYAHVVLASFPVDRWSAVYFSWLSLKGWLAGLHYLESTNLYATEYDGRIYVNFAIVFSSAEAVGAWLEHGYPIEEMLRSLGVADADIRGLLMRDL
jgi:hypothetical protein